MCLLCWTKMSLPSFRVVHRSSSSDISRAFSIFSMTLSLMSNWILLHLYLKSGIWECSRFLLAHFPVSFTSFSNDLRCWSDSFCASSSFQALAGTLFSLLAFEWRLEPPEEWSCSLDSCRAESQYRLLDPDCSRLALCASRHLSARLDIWGMWNRIRKTYGEYLWRYLWKFLPRGAFKACPEVAKDKNCVC